MRIACPRCSKPLTFPDAAAGKVAQCPACQGKLRLPAPASPTPAPTRPTAAPKKPVSAVTPKVPNSPPVRSSGESPRRARSVEVEAPRGRNARYVPDDEEETVPTRRRRYRDEYDDTEEEEPKRGRGRRTRNEDDDDDDRRPRQRRRPKRRRSAPFRLGWGKVFLGMFAFDVLMLVFGLILWMLMGSLGMVLPMTALLLIGTLLGCVGSIWILVIAFQDQAIEGVLCLFIPFYVLYYVSKNPETHMPFVLCLFSWLFQLTSIGGTALVALREAPRPNPPPGFQRPVNRRFGLNNPEPNRPIDPPPVVVVPPPQPPAVAAALPKVAAVSALDDVLADIGSHEVGTTGSRLRS